METMASTVQIYKILSSKEVFTDEEAQILATAMEHKDNLATRDELYATKAELKQDIAYVKAELADVKAELKQDIADVKAELADVKAELKQDIADVKAELKNDIAGVRTELHAFELGFEKISRKQLWTTFILIVTIIAVNPKSVEIILKAIGIIK